MREAEPNPFRAKADRRISRPPENLRVAVQTSLAEWQRNKKVHRLWAADASLRTGADEDQWLGWLRMTDEQLTRLRSLRSIAEGAKRAGFSHVLLLGTGGSSLCPEVIRRTFGTIVGHPELLVLDSTDPAQILAFENQIDLAHTLFIRTSVYSGKDVAAGLATLRVAIQEALA